MAPRATALIPLLLAAGMAHAAWVLNAQPPGDQADAFHPAGDELYCSSYLGKVYVTTDHAQSWTEVGVLDHATNIQAMVVDGDWILIARSTWGGKYRNHRTEAGWGDWEPLPDQEPSYASFTAFQGKIYASREGDAVVTDDHGTTWTPLTPPDDRRVFEMFAARGWLFAVTYEVGEPDRALYRTQDGAIWEVASGLPQEFIPTARVEHLGALYVVCYYGGGQGDVYRSDDDGATFQHDGGFPLAQAPSAFASLGPHLAVGYPSVLPVSCFVREDDGPWLDFADGIPDVASPFNQLAAQGGHFYKTGGTVSTYRVPAPAVTTVGGVPAAAPVTLDVQPNPFNPRARLVVDWAGRPAVPARLAIYDPGGRLVRQVPLNPGQTELDWDGRDGLGRDAPSGTYLLRLEADGRALTQRRATLVR